MINSDIISTVKSVLHSNNDYISNISFVLVDIDHFTNINSKIGDKEGDKTLERVYKYLQISFVKSKILKYGGGDDFLFIINSIDKENLEEQLVAFCKKFRKEKFISPELIYAKAPITISIGCAVIYSDETIFRSLKLAEIALSMAKKNGRNRMCFSPSDSLLNYKIKNKNSSTLIGHQLRGYTPDGKLAHESRLCEPYGVEVSPRNELVYVDRGNNCIRKICKNGRIKTIAGNTTSGYSGNGNSAVSAALNKPSGVAFDYYGNMFIADTGNHCIRMVNKSGFIYTVAGSTQCGYEGDGSMAVKAKLNRPGGVVVDSLGNIYTNDYGNNVIRRITKDGVIDTIAGNGKFGYDGDNGCPLKATLNKPYGHGITPDGRYLYIADYGNNCIREVDTRKNTITTIAGIGSPGYEGDNGNAKEAKLNGPFWVYPYKCLVFIADANNHCIRMVNKKTGMIYTLIGNGVNGFVDDDNDLLKARLNMPAGLIIDRTGKYMYIADYCNNAIRKVNIGKIIC